MDLALLIDKYLSDKRHLIGENDSFNIVEGSIHRWDFGAIVCPTMEELEALQPQVQAEQSQAQINAQSMAFLSECDWKRQRHISQKALGIATSLSDEEYLTMEAACQAAREAIVK